MYNVVNDAGNVYVYDEDDNLISFKNPEVLVAIKNDNSIITGDEGVEDIIEYANNYVEPSDEEEVPELPWYLSEEEMAKGAIQEEE